MADEFHLHGYDIKADLTPGVGGAVNVTASIPGKFDIELEDSGLTLGNLEVR